ncbi:hypothetical protein [uncultured Nostoc sp.]|uniref:hypothetical protein n=1 Tax=uncultured Nostoc sp. TaxID=340711 RepID=UPI0035CAFBE2
MSTMGYAYALFFTLDMTGHKYRTAFALASPLLPKGEASAKGEGRKGHEGRRREKAIAAKI